MHVRFRDDQGCVHYAPLHQLSLKLCTADDGQPSGSVTTGSGVMAVRVTGDDLRRLVAQLEGQCVGSPEPWAAGERGQDVS